MTAREPDYNWEHDDSVRFIMNLIDKAISAVVSHGYKAYRYHQRDLHMTIAGHMQGAYHRGLADGKQFARLKSD